MNVCIMSGYLTKDAEVKTTDSGKKMARLSYAVRKAGSDNSSDFFNAIAWDKRAEYIENGKKEGRFLNGCHVFLKGQNHNVSFDVKDSQTGEVRKVKYDALTIEESYSEKQPVQSGYQTPAPQAQGGYQAAAPQAQGGYQMPAPQVQGGYQMPVPQAQGGYQAAVPQAQGGYQAAAPQAQGGYQAAAPQARGGYQAAAPQTQGGYQAAVPQAQQDVQTGYFQQVSPAQQGGYKPASVEAPRAAYGGYPETPGYGN